jgi:beta-lactamase superfamily II metal-dependent hydrolase
MSKKILGIIIIFVIVLVFLLTVFIKKEDSTKFKIYFFNAGKADAILIMNNDHYIMIDTGEEELTSEILNYFRNNNINKLDYLIITHFDKDHVGSASKIIDNLEIGEILQSNYPKDSEYYNNYLESIIDKNINPITVTNEEYNFDFEGIKVKVNGPSKEYDKNESNNSSLIVSMVYNETSYLFMGDAQKQRVEDFIADNNSVYDFVKSPYHGKYYKKLDDLYENIKVKYAVMTCSDEEGCEDETIQVMNDHKIKYYMTKNGEIDIVSDGKKIVINQ